VAGGVLFAVVATANGAGYRYGVSDQAFYIPVVTRALDPAAFPRDSSLIDAQGTLMLADEVIAGVIRATGLSIDVLFLIAYLASIGLLWAAVVLIGTRVYRHPLAIAALGAALTLRHRIPRTSANSFEPYFHPRMFAFGLGALAVAAVLRGRAWGAVALIAISAVVHITTALWFAVLVGTALAILYQPMRRLAVGGATAAATVLQWAATLGPLHAANVTMDDTWLQAVAGKDSLFPTGWPAWAWLANLGLLPLLWWVHRIRVRRGQATREDEALVWGATALVVLFLVTLPPVAAGFSLAVQFQISRVFWLVDFVTTVYAIAAIADAPSLVAPSRAGRPFTGRLPRRAIVLASALVAFAAGRGAYVMLVERPDRPLFAVHLQESPWEDAMRWIAQQPRDVHLLADPGHAWKYGTSARVSSGRDVLVEEVKDSALAIYSREVAARFVERTQALGDFGALTPDHAAEMAQRYDLDYLVTENDLPLPLAYRNSQFRIYSLR
jgi:hypothetical protein